MPDHKNPKPIVDQSDASRAVSLWRWVSVDAAVVLTVVVATLYVVLAGLYDRFYQALHTRPEEVGFDRAAILSRTYWLVLSIVLLVTVATPVAAQYRQLPPRFWTYLGGAAWGGAALLAVLTTFRVSSGRWLLFVLSAAGEVVAFWLMFLAVRSWHRSEQTRKLQLWMLGGTILIVIGSVDAAGAAVDSRARQAQAGSPVSPVSWNLFPIVRVAATPARIAWLDKGVKQKPILGDPWLLYLGQSDRVAVFMACGQTVITKADKVEVITRIAENRASKEVRKAFGDKARIMRSPLSPRRLGT